MKKLLTKINQADRKTKTAWTFFAAAVILLLAAALFLFGKKERIVSVVKYEGENSVEREARNIPIFSGMRVERGDMVVTGEKSSVTMSVDEDKLVRVAELTRVSFEEITSKKSGQTTRIRLESGTIVNDIREKLDGNSTYNITTPNATISVRGTHFVVYVGKEDGYEGTVTKVNVYDGTVEVVNQSGEVIVLYADKAQEDRMDSMVVLPQGNRAIVGSQKIVVNEGVDYSGLNIDDFKRLSEIAEKEESALDADEIGERIKELTTEENAEEAKEKEILKNPFENIVNNEPDDTEEQGKDTAGEDIIIALTDPAPSAPEAPVPVIDEIVIKPITPPADDKENGGQQHIGDNKPGGEDNPGGGDKPGEEDKPVDEDKKYAPALLVISGKSDIEEKIAVLKNRVSILKTITTPDREALIKSYEDSIKAASEVLKDVDEINEVLTLINELPMPGKITISDKTAVEGARRRYRVLSAEQTELIPERSIRNLEACEAKVK